MKHRGKGILMLLWWRYILLLCFGRVSWQYILPTTVMLLITTLFNPATPFLGICPAEIKDLRTMMFLVVLLRWLKFGSNLNIFQLGND